MAEDCKRGPAELLDGRLLEEQDGFEPYDPALDEAPEGDEHDCTGEDDGDAG